MNNLDIVKEIIKEQSLIIGKQLARNRAEASGEVKFKSDNIDEPYLTVDGPSTISKVVKSFEEVFGAASTQVCDEVIKKMHSDK